MVLVQRFGSARSLFSGNSSGMESLNEARILVKVVGEVGDVFARAREDFWDEFS